jgi:hypothetical protein
MNLPIETVGLLVTIVLGDAALILAVVVYGKQKRQAALQARFLENFAANRHNSADITMSGTRVTPGTGEMVVEGHAPVVGTQTRNNTESREGGTT